MKRTLLTLLATLLYISVSAQDACWISADEPFRNERNTWIEFRKDFRLGSTPKKAEAKIAADSKYWLWINGENIVFEGSLKRGPDPDGSYYDIVDLDPYLKRGKNELRLLLCYFGKDGFSHKSSGSSGVIFDSPAIKLRSNASWLSRILPEYQFADNPLENYRLPEANIRYDARLADGGEWRSSVELGRWGDAPWGNLIERPIPLWKDYGIRHAGFTQSYDTDGNVVYSARLPYNMQMTPVIELTDNNEGTLVRIETDHVMGGSEPCIRAEYITVKGNQTYESLGWMNGDELKVILPKDSQVTLHRIGYRETGYNCTREGTFRCSDETINRFWEKAMRTLYVNMRDTYFDCPDRERAQWWGDVTVLIGQSFYQLSPIANNLMVKAMHELVNWQREDGTLYSPVPAGNWNRELPAQMLSSISTYGFWYYYLHTGDRETMKYVYPAVRRYLDLWKLDDDGLTEYRAGDWSWGDWGTQIDLRLILASWHYLALQSAINMAEVTGNEADIAGYQEIRKSIYESFNRCWNGYCYRHPSYLGATDDRIHAMAVLSGLADESKYETIFNVFQQQEYASPYMEKYVLEALVKMGYGDYALGRFKRRFATMIEDPLHTTLYEGWEEGGYGGGSTNHAWSGGMLTVIAEQICGVRPLVPGWSEFIINPVPVIDECAIEIPSVRGLIKSSFKDTDQAFTMHIMVPEGTKARLSLSKIDYTELLINGAVSDDNATLEAGSYKIICRK